MRKIDKIKFFKENDEIEISAWFKNPDDFCGQVVCIIDVETKKIRYNLPDVNDEDMKKISQHIDIVNKKIDFYHKFKNKPRYKELILITEKGKLGFSFIRHSFEKTIKDMWKF